MRAASIIGILGIACAPGGSASGDTLSAAVPSTAAAGGNQQTACLIDSAGIAGVRLGMTLDEVRRALPAARLERQEDGDGVLWVTVTVDTSRLVTLHAGEEDPAIDWTKQVTIIETFHPACRTADGVHPGALVADVERTWGATSEIVLSEIESREYVTFERQPAWLTLRLDYTGIFPEGSRRTTQYKKGARLFSMSISVTSP